MIRMCLFGGVGQVLCYFCVIFRVPVFVGLTETVCLLVVLVQTMKQMPVTRSEYFFAQI